jgi:hypothetical protein
VSAYAYGKADFVLGEKGNFFVAVLGSKVIDHAYEVVACCVWCHLGFLQYGFSFHSESSVCELAFLLGGMFSWLGEALMLYYQR